jgi:malate dehydrogenase (oxaloacetate-decarboxylating)
MPDAAQVNFEVALAVLDQAVEEGVARADVPAKDERRKWAEAKRWTAEYSEFEYAKDGIV